MNKVLPKISIEDIYKNGAQIFVKTWWIQFLANLVVQVALGLLIVLGVLFFIGSVLSFASFFDGSFEDPSRMIQGLGAGAFTIAGFVFVLILVTIFLNSFLEVFLSSVCLRGGRGEESLIAPSLANALRMAVYQFLNSFALLFLVGVVLSLIVGGLLLIAAGAGVFSQGASSDFPVVVTVLLVLAGILLYLLFLIVGLPILASLFLNIGYYVADGSRWALGKATSLTFRGIVFPFAVIIPVSIAMYMISMTLSFAFMPFAIIDQMETLDLLDQGSLGGIGSSILLQVFGQAALSLAYSAYLKTTGAANYLGLTQGPTGETRSPPPGSTPGKNPSPSSSEPEDPTGGGSGAGGDRFPPPPGISGPEQGSSSKPQEKKKYSDFEY